MTSESHPLAGLDARTTLQAAIGAVAAYAAQRYGLKATIPDTYEYDVIRAAYTDTLFEAFIGYASSEDGSSISERLPEPIYEPKEDFEIKKMEGAEITPERLDYVIKAYQGGTLLDQVFCAFIGPTPREDFIPYLADFFLQLEDVRWTIIAGIVNETMVISVRNLG